jgi:D-sedoheptulose 7-phosphate isomerase
MAPALDTLCDSIPDLAVCKEDLNHAFELLRNSYKQKGKLLICGNGGSAADSEHIAGELMKGFISKRPIPDNIRRKFKDLFPEDGDFLADNLQGALPTISLVSHSALITAFINDVTAETVFAQQVYGYGQEGDALLAISTSGNSPNVVRAVQVAKALGLKTIGLTGQGGGKLAELCDVTIKAPRKLTHHIQELHLPIYHALCIALEEEFFSHQ